MSWTGGQYSLYRAALAITAGCTTAEAMRVASGAGHSVAGVLVVAVALSASIALGIGFQDRVAACLLVPLVALAELMVGGSIAVPSWTRLLTERSGLLLAVLLGLHAATPRAPFGALDARGRVDPRGAWLRPGWMTEVGWSLLLLVAAASILLADGDRSTTGRTFDGPLARYGPELAAAAAGLLFRRTRRAAWSVLMLWHLAQLFAFGPKGGEASRLLLILLAAEPGAWSGRTLRSSATRPTTANGEAIATAGARIPARLFYDGDCGFCHRSVRFILAEELATPASLRLRFAPLGSATFGECLARHPELDPATLPDSIVLELEDGSIRTRSAAALEIASRLGGGWRFVAIVGSQLPSRLLDTGYDAIARIRKQLFAQPKDACPILPPDLRARFDA